jgi:serine/threonine protein kinase
MTETNKFGSESTKATMAKGFSSESNSPSEMSILQVLKDGSKIGSSPFREVGEGDVVDGYTILSLIGRGGMGKVFKVKEELTGKVAALKTLTFEPGMSETEQEAWISRFTNEVQIMWRLFDHKVPNVPTIFHMPKAPLGLIMELLSGIELEEWLKKEDSQSMPQRARLVSLLARISESLAKAHAMGIVHRDLKPSNIMIQNPDSPLSEKLRPILVDFGIAKNSERELTTDNTMMGTPSYMSPEQLMGKTNSVSGASDVFSMGMLLFKCLTGQEFYEDLIDPKAPFFERIMAMIAVHENLKSNPAASLKRMELLEPVSRAIFMSCVAFNSQERYPTCEELRRDLDLLAESYEEHGSLNDEPPQPEHHTILAHGSTKALSAKGMGNVIAPPPAPPSLILHPVIPPDSTQQKRSIQKPLVYAGIILVTLVVVLGVMGVFSSGNKPDKNLWVYVGKQVTSKNAKNVPQKAASCSGSAKERVDCYFKLLKGKSHFASYLPKMYSLLERGCSKDGTLLKGDSCSKLILTIGRLHMSMCKSSSSSNVSKCVIKSFENQMKGGLDQYWMILGQVLSLCHGGIPRLVRASKQQCVSQENNISKNGREPYNTMVEPLRDACLKKRPKYYKNNPSVLMVCVRKGISKRNYGGELKHMLIQQNYWQFCKRNKIYNRATPEQCKHEEHRVRSIRQSLSNSRSKLIRVLFK